MGLSNRFTLSAGSDEKVKMMGYLSMEWAL